MLCSQGKKASIGLTFFKLLADVLKCLSYLSSESLPVKTWNLFVTPLPLATTHSLFFAIRVVCPQERMEPFLLEFNLTWSYHLCGTALWPMPMLGTATECHAADWYGRVVDFGMHSFVSCLPGLLNLRSISRNLWSSLMLCRFHVPNADSKTEVISGTENE